jgi:hypothetical protein
MSKTSAPMPAAESRCWRDPISPETGATPLTLTAEFSDTDPMVESASQPLHLRVMRLLALQSSGTRRFC